MGEAWETISKPSPMWEILLEAQILRMSGVAISLFERHLMFMIILARKDLTSAP
jgi:hypothetical protein